MLVLRCEGGGKKMLRSLMVWSMGGSPVLYMGLSYRILQKGRNAMENKGVCFVRGRLVLMPRWDD